MNYEIQKAEVEETQSPEDLFDDLLPGNQEQALVALLSHGSIKEAAEATSISEATMWRYTRRPAFRRRYRRARRDLLLQVTQSLQQYAVRASRVLCDIAEDKNASASARVSASRAILDRVFRAVEDLDLDERIEELETAQARSEEAQLLGQEGGQDQ